MSHRSQSRGAKLAVAVLFAGALTAACVDLFHSTDFPTLCVDNPTDPQCRAADGGSDVTTAETGADAARPHPDFCSWSPHEVYQHATEVCARIGGCVGPLDPNVSGPLGGSQFAACVISAQLAFDCAANPSLRPAGLMDDFWSCVATAGNCGEITQCVYPRGIDSCGSDAGTGGNFYACGSQGNANTRIKCSATAVPTNALAATPCTMLGQICARDDAGASSACSGKQGLECTVSGCSGTWASDCQGSHDVGLDCSQQTATCVEATSGVPACQPISAPSCSLGTPATPECSDSFVRLCVGKKLVQVDCSLLGKEVVDGGTAGMTCDSAVSPPAPLYAIANMCNQPTSECDASLDGCQGNILTSCARGQEISVSCTAVGFNSCTDTGDTLDNPSHCSDPQPTF